MTPVPIEMIQKKKTVGAAFTLACDTSGLDDKEIYMAFAPPIDAGYFSRMKKGTATLDGDRVGEFCRIVKNTVYPEWVAFQVGCTLMMIQTEAERLAKEAQAEAKRLESENKLLRQLLQGKAA
ncbi:transcriptional regulator [Trinickia mobilis]|uniref:transcriptional regulator n=1 Tax=Trinickia mobilis TaxID=2816356 RepID=UPI001A8F31FE|nr:transcriptional regulator [Trinickia mobilis]